MRANTYYTLITSSCYCKVACVLAHVVSGCDHDMDFTGREIESHANRFSAGCFFIFTPCYFFLIALSLLIYHGIRLDISLIICKLL